MRAAGPHLLAMLSHTTHNNEGCRTTLLDPCSHTPHTYHTHHTHHACTRAHHTHALRRAGKLDAQRAKALGVDPTLFKYLKLGVSQPGGDGRLVHPSECVAPPRHGRRVAIAGSCVDAGPLVERLASTGGLGGAPTGVDVLIRSTAPPPGDARARREVAAAAGAEAQRMGARELVLLEPSTASLTSREVADPGYPAALVGYAPRPAMPHHAAPALSPLCPPSRRPGASPSDPA